MKDPMLKYSHPVKVGGFSVDTRKVAYVAALLSAPVIEVSSFARHHLANLIGDSMAIGGFATLAASLVFLLITRGS